MGYAHSHGAAQASRYLRACSPLAGEELLRRLVAGLESQDGDGSVFHLLRAAIDHRQDVLVAVSRVLLGAHLLHVRRGLNGWVHIESDKKTFSLFTGN